MSTFLFVVSNLNAVQIFKSKQTVILLMFDDRFQYIRHTSDDEMIYGHCILPFMQSLKERVVIVTDCKCVFELMGNATQCPLEIIDNKTEGKLNA